MNKLIISLAPTGIIPTKEMNPSVPTSVQEIITDVLRCANLGVSVVHLHARDDNDNHTYKKEIYAQIISGIRKKRPDLVIVVSTSGRMCPEITKRAEVLNLEGELKPDMASLTLGSHNFSKHSSMNSPGTIMELARMMKEHNIKPELEIFDLGMVNYAKYLIKKGLLDPPYFFNLILGNIAGAQATLLHAGLIISELPENSFCNITAIGNSQKKMNALGVVMTEGVRVGLEDNLWYDEERSQLATNYSLVERVVRLAQVLDRPIASGEDVRRMLQLPVQTNSLTNCNQERW